MTAADLFRALLVAAGLLLPGWGWARAFRWPLAWFGGGMLSAAILFTAVLALHAMGVAITLASLAGLLVAAGMPGWCLAWVRRAAPAATPEGLETSAWWLALPALPLVAVACWRAGVQPLSGADTVFRWNLLAEIIARQGSLAGYPPATAQDFTQYFWADGIAPLVASLYAWAYLAGGHVAAGWTALPVLLQSAGLLVLLHALGREWGGPRGGWLACACGGATMVLQFAFNLGQETGLTALGAGGMVFYLLRWSARREWRLLVPAAIAAGIAASAREYGAGAALAAAGWLLANVRRAREPAAFLAMALVLPLAWHLRVWFITGNPLYAHEFAGLPTNPVFALWMQRYRDLYAGHWSDPAAWGQLARLVAIGLLPALLGLGAGGWRWRGRTGWGLTVAVTAAFLGAWWISVPSTAGGLFYSLRVLSPVALLGCAWGGAWLAGAATDARRLTLAWLGLALLAGDASLRAWTLPANPYEIPPARWPEAGDEIQRDFLREDAPFLREAARRAGPRVLTDSAGLQDFFRAEGKSCSPFWSPDVAWLFRRDGQTHAPEHLRALGFTHVLLKRSSITFDFLAATGALPALDGRLRVVAMNPTFVLLEIAPDHP